MNFSNLTLAGAAKPQTVVDVDVKGADGPVTLNDVPLILQIYPAESPALQHFSKAAALLPPVETKDFEAFDDYMKAGKTLADRDLDMLAHIICGWNVPGVEYSAEAFKGLIEHFPEVFLPIQNCVMMGFAETGKSSAASSTGRRKPDTLKKTTDER